MFMIIIEAIIGNYIYKYLKNIYISKHIPEIFTFHNNISINVSDMFHIDYIIS
jgi:hypothetical protein